MVWVGKTWGFPGREEGTAGVFRVHFVTVGRKGR